MKEEIFVCVMLDCGGHVIRKMVMSQGDGNSVRTDMDTIIKEAVFSKASNLVIAHSHPCGFAAPSQQDLDETEQLSRTLRALNINLCEHVIFAKNEYYLMSTYRFRDPKTLIFRQISN